MLTDKELEIIRRKMAQLEMEPPATAWDDIKTEIKPRKQFRAYWWVGGSLLVLGLLLFLNFSKQQNQQLAGKPIQVGEHNNQANLKTSGRPLQLAKPVITRKNLKNNPLTWPLAPALNPPLNFTRKPNKSTARAINQRTVKSEKYQALPGVSKATRVTEKTRSTEQVIINFTTQNSEDSVYTTKEQAVAADSATKLQQAVRSKSDSAGVKPLVTSPNKSQKEKKEDWLLGFLVAPNYAFRSVVSHAPDSLFATYLKNRHHGSAERFGLELGLLVSKPITTPLHWEATIAWLKLKENFTYQNDSPVFNSLQNTRQLVSTYHYGRTQVGLTYYFRERSKSKFNVTVAGGANWLLTGKTYQSYNGQWQDSSESTRRNLLAPANYHVAVGLGFSKPLGSLFEGRLMPTFTYYLGSIYRKQEPFRLRPYTFGLQLTFKRRFSRAPDPTKTTR
ncbi:porin family protein [Adhaeribacter pallidiroseus]|uniref:Outer membrane protein beta-barrel domain-containing protein n=1 Tax=Adhaeribacter pallidiroseus TaxID=2072847 RepID=A0A369QSA7_9BACT|nr:hypothetical protein [Adhaeribacter pallidiroseus]RDC66206.1 hypothetical protein AHMF7616_04837 [Adhaeribacter pallidiroseus]